MLERLARWLRVLGYDVESAGTLPDRELVRCAVAEDRILLTRDKRLSGDARASTCLLIQSSAPLDQLLEVTTNFGLSHQGELFTRCLLCNPPLQLITSVAAEEQVPSGVRERAESVRECASCGRIYWEGAHTRRMRAALERTLGQIST